MKEVSCCFTGHRIIDKKEVSAVKRGLKSVVRKMAQQGYSRFLCGGALGFDTLAAKTVMKCKKDYPQIKLIMVLPCEEQTKFWKEKDIRTYQKILKKADEVIYTSKNYDAGCMPRRNRYMVDQSSVCICYIRQNSGGTAYTVKVATQKGLKRIRL